jgi:hypothetical protein
LAKVRSPGRSRQDAILTIRYLRCGFQNVRRAGQGASLRSTLQQAPARSNEANADTDVGDRHVPPAAASVVRAISIDVEFRLEVVAFLGSAC